MTPTTRTFERELAHRAGDGIDVSLYWDERTNRITINLYDAQCDESFELEVEGALALDAFRHPFAYATARHTKEEAAAPRRRPRHSS